MIMKHLILVYAVGAYGLALLNLVYLIGFFADIGVPKGISDGKVTTTSMAILADASLIGLFGLHHSITARSSFKRWWTKHIPAPIERASYLYMTTVMMACVVILWQPVPILIWQVSSDWAVGIIYGIYLTVWVIMFAATFHFGHFEFFGVKQAWIYFRQIPPKSSGMTARYLYAIVRHPISLGWMITPLITPNLTVGHLVFAGTNLIYILLATPFEEKDLIEVLGTSYQDYRNRVHAFVPFLNIKQSSERKPNKI